MSRLKAVGDREFVDGIPELWTIVLDQMARNGSIADVRTALRCDLAVRFGQHVRARQLVQEFCLSALKQKANLVLDLPLSLLSGDPSRRAPQAMDLLRLVRHRPVALLLAADQITSPRLPKPRRGEIVSSWTVPR